MDKEKVRRYIDQIDVPKEDVLNAITKGIKKGRYTKKRYSKQKKILVCCMTTVLMFGIIFLMGWVINPKVNQVLAKVPFIGEIYEKFDDELGVKLAEKNLVTELNQDITKNGVTVELNDVYFDGNIVSIIGQVNGDLKTEEISFDVNFENNKGDNDPWLNGKSMDIEQSGDGYDFQWRLEYPHKVIKESFTLPITIHAINNIKGSWNFNIPITQEVNQVLAINQLKEFPNDQIKINIHEINQAQASSTIVFETVSAYKDDHIDFYKAIDNKGNELFNYENSTRISSSKSGDGYHLTLRKNMESIDKGAESITLYPYMEITELPVQKLLNVSTFEMKSKRTALSIKVKNIIKEENKVIIDFQFQGLSKKWREDHHFNILLNNLSYSFKLIDNDISNSLVSRSKVKILDKDTNDFQSIFVLENNQVENFSLQKTILEFDFTGFIDIKTLEPFTLYLPN
ncbi:DUF4179 domain-containing protein [Paraliobacillus sp. JSM ZJ581]|uniref:DUF4179 domain-containing protein n=1 Tax=Paraliobacillus sp. JSM ZJ581 TaxID=3342118 RepID=UPI0035A98425